MCRRYARALKGRAKWLAPVLMLAAPVLAPVVAPGLAPAAGAGPVAPVGRTAGPWADVDRAPAVVAPTTFGGDGATREHLDSLVPVTGDIRDDGTAAVITFDAASQAHEEAPVVVPLPPALGPGLAGLAGVAVLRVRRRAARRR